MKFLLQRVTRAEVRIDGSQHAVIGPGLLVFIGIAATDTQANADHLAEKLVHLRIFEDAEGKMNRNALESGAEVLLVSQFTLYGNCTRGRRPSFDEAAKPAEARELYEYAVRKIREQGLPVKTGVFQAHMDVELVNDGPVTFILENSATSVARL